MKATERSERSHIGIAFNAGIVGWFLVFVLGLQEWVIENMGWFEWFVIMLGSALLYFAVMRTLRLIYDKMIGEDEDSRAGAARRPDFIGWILVVVGGAAAGALISVLGSMIGG